MSRNTNLLKIYVSRHNITRSAKLKKTNFEKNPLPGYTVLITKIYVLITEKILFHSVALLSKLSAVVSAQFYHENKKHPKIKNHTKIKIKFV